MNKYLLLPLAILCICITGPAEARPRLPRLPSNLVNAQKIIKNIKIPQILSVRPNTLPPLIRHLAHTPEIAVKETALDLQAPIRATVLPLRETVSEFTGLAEPFTATSFVIEEEFEGKKQLWGVTAAHIARIMSAYPAVWLEDYAPFPVEFAAIGNAGMLDLALFQLPEEWPRSIPALKLAEQTPKPGEKTYSFGFFNDDFFLVPNREIKEVTPTRLITSLEIETSHRGGACGSPILNTQGEVVGVHIGSSDSKQISFAVPAAEIKRMLQAYHNKGQSLQPLLFNGKKIGDLNVNESISRVLTVTDGYTTGDFVTYHYEKDVDYAHLETLSPDADPDEVHIIISHQMFSYTDKTDKDFFIQLIHNVASGETVRRVIPYLSYPHHKPGLGRPFPGKL